MEPGSRDRIGWPRNPVGSRSALGSATSILVLSVGMTLAVQPAPAQQSALPPAVAQDAIAFDIPAQDLNAALLTFADRAGLQLVFDVGLVEGLRNAALNGTFTAREGLSRLLAGTGMTFRFNGANTVTLERAVVQPESGPLRLDDITVTARRTEELVQNVPGSVFVLPAEEIEKSNIQDLEDLALRTPNLIATETGSRASSSISIRGISDLTGVRGTSPTVGVYLDEVMLNPASSTAGIDPNLLDLERAEVLYGPQGTVFGRGTIGGAVNYVTKRPTEDFEAELDGEIGSHPDGLVRGLLNGSLTGDRTLMARLVAFGRYDDGFIDTPNIGGSVDSQDYGGRLSLRSQPSDRLTLDLAGSFDRTVFRAPNYATLDSIDGDGDLEFLINRGGENSVDRGLITFRGTYDFDFGTLISNTSYLDLRNRLDQDADWTQVDIFFGENETHETSVVQELRFEGEPLAVPLLGETSFLLGANTMWYEEDSDVRIFTGADSLRIGLPPGTRVPLPPSKEEIFDLGVFGEFRIRPIEKLELSLGGRFSFANIEVSQEGLEPASQSFNAFTPKASILYDWTDDLSTYALISTGFKSGGFNTFGTGPLSGREFDNETAINYEGGFKSSWFDDRLFVNASGFALFYEDIQVVQRVNLSGFDATAIGNAASARSLGAELEVAALPAEGLQLNLAYGFADARFTDYEDAPGGNLTDERLPNAPRHTLSLVADYAYPVFDDFADAYIRTEYSYTSNFTTTAEVDRELLDSFDVFNLRLGLRADRFDVELFAENLFDEKYITGTTGGGSLAPVLGVSPPFEVGTTRRLGIRGRLRF